MARMPARLEIPNPATAHIPAARLFLATAMTEAMVNPSGILCRMTAPKMTMPSQFEIMKPQAMHTPSKNVWVSNPPSAA